MPVPTPSRHSRTTSPPALVSTPSRSGGRSLASYSNYTPTITSGGTSSRINIVTRVALEGRAKHGDDGASIKMYLKIAVPTDSVTPSTSVPLFPEENVKIMSSQVHPLDNNSVPYNFSSTLSPLLHKAACALNLPARSHATFNSAFDVASSNVSTPSSARGSKHENPEAIPPVDPQYTGQILVSGYNISYVLPKYFPIHETDEPYPRTPSRSRRMSISERNTAQFMVAIDMWVPYASRPPRHPYLLSIPTPRCLHNHIKLKIFPPNNSNTSASYASLSSVEDEASSWDLTSDPHVTRATTSTRSLGRNNSYGNIADDESSDSSTAGFADGCGIQGTFPSAERIRIRWARPSKSVNLPGGGRDGRRRVGVKTVKGEMTCLVRGKRGGTEPGTPEGILMDVSYTGSCSGVWFPGVATLLGMDVGLEAKGCDVLWPEGGSPHWDVKGGSGFTGFDVGPSSNVPQHPNSRGSSFESGSQGDDLSSSHDSTQGFLSAQPQASRSSSTSSTASLLRAPLPAGNVGEYSFEGSNASLAANGLDSSQMGTVSTIPSMSASMQSLGQNPNPPGLPITLHLNINDLLPPAKNHFTFTISGTVVLAPKNTISRMGGIPSRSSSPTESVMEGLAMLPKFTVLAADSETTTTTVKNEMETPHGAVDVYHATGDIRDAQAKKTVLQRGGFTKCGNEGARIAVKDHDPFKRDELASMRRPATPSVPSRPTSQAIALRSPGHAVPYAPSPTISVVQAKIFPFPSTDSVSPTAYCVSLQLNAPATRDSEWLEFGFAHDEGSASSGPTDAAREPPKLQLVSATCEGVPIEVESSVSTEEIEMSMYGIGFEKMGGQSWVSWVKLRVGEMYGGHVSVEYIVKGNGVEPTQGKGKQRGNTTPVLLPTFSLPVSKFDVMICDVKGHELQAVTSNFAYQQAVADGRRLMHFSADAWFYPHLTLAFAERKDSGSRAITQYFVLTWFLLTLASFAILRALGRLPQVNITLPEHQFTDNSVQTEWSPITVSATVYETVTVEAISTVYETATVYTTSTEMAPQSSRQQSISTSSQAPSPPSLSRTPPLSTTRRAPLRPTTTRNPPRSTPTSLASTPRTLTPTPQPTSTSHQFSLEPFRETFKLYLPEDLDDLYTKAGDVASVVWQILRKAWHYPLPPP